MVKVQSWEYMVGDVLFELERTVDNTNWLYVGDDFWSYLFGYVSDGIASYLHQKILNGACLYDMFTTITCLRRLEESETIFEDFRRR